MYMNRPEASTYEQAKDNLWNNGRRISELKIALQNNERRFGKGSLLTKQTRAELKAAMAETPRLRELANQAN